MTTNELQSLLKPYIEEVKKLYGKKLHSIVLYGSYARNEQMPDSDIDIMIFVDMTEEELAKYEDQLSDITYEFNMDHDVDIEPVEKSLEFFNYWVNAYPFYANVKRDGVTVYAAG